MNLAAVPLAAAIFWLRHERSIEVHRALRTALAVHACLQALHRMGGAHEAHRRTTDPPREASWDNWPDVATDAQLGATSEDPQVTEGGYAFDRIGLMAGYTPVFDSVYAGTLCGRWPTTAVWVTLLPLCDKHGQIDLSHQAICALTGWPLELLKQGIEELMRADPDSRSNAQDGRRLVLLDPENRSWGWRVVNHGLYREKARKLQYDNERTSSGRDALRKKESRDVPRSPDASREVPLSDSDSDSDSDKDKNKTQKQDRRTSRAVDEPAEFASIRQEYPKRAGGQRWGDALKFFQRRIREGERVDVIVDGVKRYAAYARATGLERTEKVQQAATFLGDNRGYLEPWQPPPRPVSAVERIQSRMRNGNGVSDERVVSEQSGGASLESTGRLLR